MSDEKLVYSPDEAAEMLGVGRSYVFAMISNGEIESFKIGRLRKIPHDALTAYIKRQRGGQVKTA